MEGSKTQIYKVKQRQRYKDLYRDTIEKKRSVKNMVELTQEVSGQTFIMTKEEKEGAARSSVF